MKKNILLFVIFFFSALIILPFSRAIAAPGDLCYQAGGSCTSTCNAPNTSLGTSDCASGICCRSAHASSNQGIGCGSGFGPLAFFLCNELPAGPGKEIPIGQKLNDVLGKIIGFLTIIAALWFVIQIIIGGYQWISSGGDKHGVETARDKMTWAFVGLLVVVLGWVIAGLIGKMLGLDILNPGNLIPTLGF